MKDCQLGVSPVNYSDSDSDDRISAWHKMIAKFRWHYISVCSLVGHDWKLADDNTIDYQCTSGCIFLRQLIHIMCASDTGLESESQNNDDT